MSAAPDLAELLEAKPHTDLVLPPPAHPHPTTPHLVPEDHARTVLADRLAALLPCLDPPKRDALQAQAMAGLALLVNDEAIRVRTAIAEAVKDLPHIPRDIILRLARDVASQVAEPILQLSPLLSEADLLELLATAPAPGAATAIARRPQLTEIVADHIAHGHDTGAITALLQNRSASIREATLEGLIARAAHHADWHRPLAQRPSLTPRATRALATIVSGQILRELSERADLSADLAWELHLAVRSDAQSTEDQTPVRPMSMEEAMTKARQMARSSPLDEETLTTAGKRGQTRLCIAMLAVAAGLDAVVVERACILRSAKGLISLIWHAGLSARCCPALQTMLLRLPPDQVMQAETPDTFPLAESEMTWQIEFLSRIGR